MTSSFTKVLLIFIIYILNLISLNGQYNCGSATIINSLPYNTSNLTTSSGASYLASEACGSSFPEQDYIFKYTPTDNEKISISVSSNSNFQMSGIYVFNSCSQPLTQCVVYEEDFDGTVDVTLIVNPGQDYYIFIGTEDTEDFDISITKEQVDGVAINKPSPTQALDVNGAIRIGEATATPYEGTIRWNPSNKMFEGYDGTEWVQLSAQKQFGTVTSTGNPESASDGAIGDNFGNSVSISGDYAIVGSYLHNTNGNANRGKAYIFEKVGNSWQEQAQLVASDGVADDQFGYSVSIFGDYTVVGSILHNTNSNADQGKAYVFHRTGSSWIQQAILTASDGATGDEFGSSVSLAGDHVVVGSRFHDTNLNTDQGKAYVFHRVGSTWTEQAILTALDGEEFDFFGWSVSISGEYAVIGSSQHDTNGNFNEGKAYIFHRTGNLWTEVSILIASDGGGYNYFGISVSISGDNVIIGAVRGKAYLFHRLGTNWIQEAIIRSSDGSSDDNFGGRVSISGEYAVVSAIYHDTNGNESQGKAYVFRRKANIWTEEAILIAPDGAVQDYFGISVAISGGDVVVGAPFHDINGNVNQGKVYFY